MYSKTLLPENKNVMTIAITETFRPHKTHLFRVYQNGFVRYNQSCRDDLTPFYDRWEPVNKGHGYYSYLRKYMEKHSVTSHRGLHRHMDGFYFSRTSI